MDMVEGSRYAAHPADRAGRYRLHATLIFAFLPLMFLPEGAGILFAACRGRRHTVLASLFVSLTIVPFLSSRYLRMNIRKAISF